jgi:UDPglucose 6-dehydrogenase
LRIAVIGCGRVGLVTGACLAAIGHQVIGADRDPNLVRELQRGRTDVYEPHLTELVRQGLQSAKLAFTTDAGAAARDNEIIFLCVGVPQLEGGKADVSALDAVARQIGSSVDSSGDTARLVVERSTVPLQTGEQLLRLLAIYNRNRGGRFRVAANPQFLREGSAVDEFLHPERILIGVDDAESEALLRGVYAPLLERSFSCPVHSAGCPQKDPPELLVTGVRSAELIKQATNAFLAVKISYANVLAELCEQLGGNVQEVTHAMGLDARIRPSLLEAGLGFGGSRLPKDLQAFRHLAERAGVEAGILQAAEEVNKRRVELFLKKIEKSLWILKGKRIALLGLAYKANTDDVRGSPALALLDRLVGAGASVVAYDPQAMPAARSLRPELACAADAFEAAAGADALVIATDWNEFSALDWGRLRDVMARPLVLDARNLLSPRQMQALGFEYHSVGRPNV